VAAGDRAPDAALPDAATGLPVRLFDVFRGPVCTLLAFGDGQVATAERIAAAYPDVVRACSIVPPDAGAPDRIRTLVDPRGQVAAGYGVGPQALILVRPDGYVGFRADPPDADALQSYLDHTLGLTTAVPAP
jgi:hypothetical protein